MSEDLINLIPKMTSNTAPSGEVRAGNVHTSNDFPAYKAFDHDITDSANSWVSNYGNPITWIEYEFPVQTWVDSYALYSRGTRLQDNFKKWEFQGSNDGIEYVTLQTISNQTDWSNFEKRVFYLDKPYKYKIFRINILENNNNNTQQSTVQEIEMYSRYNTVSFLESDGKYLTKNLNEVSFSDDKVQLTLPLDLYESVMFNGESKVLIDILKNRNDGLFNVGVCTEFNDFPSLKVQTTHELNLLQDDLIQADKIQLLNWFENEEEVELGVTGVLRGQFSAINEVKSTSEISKMVANDNNLGTKYLVSPNKSEWFRINGAEWEKVEWEDKREINNLGMSKNTLKDITDKLWDKLGNQVYLGVYLHDYESSIIDIDFQSLSHDKTPTVKDAKLYILNTQATIDMTIHGSTLVGKIKDEDEGKVQYRIVLNGEPIFPADGTYTPLSPEPNHINFKIPSKLINMGEPNSVRIDFQDAWGSEDSWQSLFLGELNGLLFMDEGGELYSDDTGEVFKNLDFGLVIAGQLTSTHKVIFKNTMGTPVKDITFTSNWGDDEPVPGVGFYFSETETPFESNTTLTLEKPMKHEEEIALYIKMGTTLGTTPEIAGKVKFCVQATEITDEEYEEIMKDFQEPEEPKVEEEQEETEE